MNYKAFACMNVALIGNEKASTTLAQGLALAGHQVYIGVKDIEDVAPDFLADEFDNVFITSIEDAAAAADLVIIATNPAQVREAAYMLDDVRNKVIIDAAYMSYDENAGYLNTLHAIKAITGSPYVVKCFNAAGFEPLPRAVRDEQAINMFVAGDNRKAKEVARLIARDLGYADCHDFGGSESATLLDEMAICYHHLAARKEKGEKIAIKIVRD
jgi:8-hydroxy-5-deazaflavin:NADPH oxidoreductase